MWRHIEDPAAIEVVNEMSPSQLPRVERILEKLARVRGQGLKCFGSESHGFRLHPPLDEADLIEFESRYGIQLPADYRAFLRFAGNGGAGPYYGIYPLEKWNDFTIWVDDEPNDDFLRLPCPLHPDIPREDDWEDQLPGDTPCRSPYQGTVSIGTQGCTHCMQLVVSGSFAGRVVYVDADGSAPYMVRNGDFLGWYERWLDELLAGYDTNWFGFGIGGTETELMDCVEAIGIDEAIRGEAAESLVRLPGLSDDSKIRMHRLLSDPVDRVRAGICRAVRKFELRSASAALSQLLADSSPRVREEAVRTAMQFDPARWSCDVLSAMHEDGGPEVAKVAFFKLADDGALSRSDFLRLLTRSPHGELRHLAAHAIEWEPGDESLLEKLLCDSDSQVRFYAVLGLRQLGAESSVSAVMELLDREDDALVIGGILKMLGESGGDEARDTLLTWASSRDDFPSSPERSLKKLARQRHWWSFWSVL